MTHAADPDPHATDDAALASTLESLDGALNYMRWILDLVRPALAAPILEVGAGRGTFTVALADVGRVDALEPGRLSSAALVERFVDDPRVRVVQGVVDDLPHRAEYGSVVMINVLEHIADDVGALRSIRTRMTHGARIAIWVPAFPLLYSGFDRQIGHHRRYRKHGLRRAVEAAGFRVTDARYVNAPGFVAWLVITKWLKQVPATGPLVTVFDRLVVPVVRRVESLVAPPFGQSILLTATNDG